MAVSFTVIFVWELCRNPLFNLPSSSVCFLLVERRRLYWISWSRAVAVVVAAAAAVSVLPGVAAASS